MKNPFTKTMLQKKQILASIFLALLVSSTFFALVKANLIPIDASSTVDVTTDHSAISYHFQRKTFYAKGRFWVFYADANSTDGGVSPTEGDMKYASSVDGLNWDITIISTGFDVPDGWMFSVAQQGDYVHLASAARTEDTDHPVIYIRGLLDSDGSIRWDAIQTAVPAFYGTYRRVGIAIDSNGHPWITYTECETTGGVPMTSYITKSSTKDGSWSTQSGFPYLLTSFAHEQMRAQPIPLTNGKIYATYGYSSYGTTQLGTIWGRLWNGNSWEAEEIVLVNSRASHGYSIVNDGDNMHAVYTDAPSNDLKYVSKIDGGGWTYGSPTTIWNAPFAPNPYGIEWIGPSLSIHRPTGDLYVFWTYDDQLYYSQRYASSGTWSSTYPWFYETYSFDDNYCSPCAFYEGGQYIGCAWTTGDTYGQPHYVKFSYLSFPTPSPSPTPATPTPSPTPSPSPTPATPTPSPTPSPEPQSEPFPTTLVATASVVSASIIGVGLLFYFKKRKH